MLVAIKPKTNDWVTELPMGKTVVRMCVHAVRRKAVASLAVPYYS